MRGWGNINNKKLEIALLRPGMVSFGEKQKTSVKRKREGGRER